jgi:hypothetical protein
LSLHGLNVSFCGPVVFSSESSHMFTQSGWLVWLTLGNNRTKWSSVKLYFLYCVHITVSTGDSDELTPLPTTFLVYGSDTVWTLHRTAADNKIWSDSEAQSLMHKCVACRRNYQVCWHPWQAARMDLPLFACPLLGPRSGCGFDDSTYDVLLSPVPWAHETGCDDLMYRTSL